MPVWQNSTSLVMRWRLVNWLINAYNPDASWIIDVLGQTPAETRTPYELTDFWIDRIFGYPLDAGIRQYIVDFIAQGRNPNFDLPLDTDPYTQDRLRAMVGLLFMSPDFQWK